MSILIEHLNKRFGQTVVCDDISLEIPSGSLVALLGPSGSGKTSLLRIIAGLEVPDSGRVLFHGEDTTHADPQARGVGFVFQHYALFNHMTIFENVAFGLREHTDKSDAEIRSIVADKLALVGLPDAAEMMPQELSGGMKKRVGLARAIATDPAIIFYDEPSSGLDPIMTAKIDELIISMQKKLGVTSVVVTHDMASACRIADRIAMIYDGALIAVDTTERFQDIKDERVQAFFRTMHHRKEAGA